MGPLGISAKQHREYLKLQSQEQREKAKMEQDESRKQQLHEIKLQEAAAKASQGIGHKEDLHAFKLKELSSPLGKAPKMNKQKLGIPTQNPLAGTEMFKQGQHKLYAQGTDTVPAMLTPGEAVIPAPAAQNPENKEVIKEMIEEGRQKNDSKEVQYLADGTTGVPFLDTMRQGLTKVAPGLSGILGGVEKALTLPQAPQSLPEVPVPQSTSEYDQMGNVIGSQLPVTPITNEVTPAKALPIPNPQAIVDEAGRKMTVAERHNNPGNLIFVGQAGAEKGEPKAGGGFWARFLDQETGRKALESQITLDTQTRGMPLDQFMNKYAPRADKNDTGAYVNTIANDLGIKPGDKVPAELIPRLADTITRVESGGKYRNTNQGRGVFDNKAGMNEAVPVLESQDQPTLAETNPAAAETAIATVAKQEHSNLDKLIQAIRDSDKPQEVKQQEAASLVEQVYGDKGIFNQGDLLRFAITAAGGMLTGGSAAGSLKYSARDVLQQSDMRHRERIAAERQQKTIDAQNQRQDKSLLTQAAIREASALDAEGRADVKAKAKFEDDYRKELIKEGRDPTAVRQWLSGGQKGSLPPIKQSFIRSGQHDLVTVDTPFMFEGKLVNPGTAMYQYQLKDPRTSDVQTMVRIGSKDVPLETAVASNIMVSRWDEGKHGSRAQVEDLQKWSDNSSKRFGEMMKSELGSDDLKGKPNPARQGQVVPMDVQTQAASWALSKGYKINDPASKLELEKINSIATSQAINDMLAGSKVKDITPYLNAAYIKQRSGLSEKLFELDPKKGTQMAPEKIVELRAKGANVGYTDDATMASEMKRLSAVWNSNTNNIQRKYKDSANETGFYMFASDVLGKMPKNK